MVDGGEGISIVGSQLGICRPHFRACLGGDCKGCEVLAKCCTLGGDLDFAVVVFISVRRGLRSLFAHTHR